MLFSVSGHDLFLLEEYFSSCDICDRPELGRTPEKLNEHSDNYIFEIYKQQNILLYYSLLAL
jgi:hypothetical protein